MIIVGRVHIRIIVRIVIGKGHLFIDVYFVRAQTAGELVCLGHGDHRRHILIGHAQVIRGEIINGKRAVVGIQTCIQDSHHHTGAVIAGTLAVEDTGAVNIDRVLHQLCLGGSVFLAHHQLLTLCKGTAGSGIIRGRDDQFKAGQERCVILAQAVGNIFLLQGSQDLRLAVCDLLPNPVRLTASQSKFPETHGAQTGIVGVHQVHDVQGNDHGDLLILSNGIRQPEHHVPIQILGIIHLQFTADPLDMRGAVFLRLHRRTDSGADKDRKDQEQSHNGTHQLPNCLVHVHSRTLFPAGIFSSIQNLFYNTTFYSKKQE